MLMVRLRPNMVVSADRIVSVEPAPAPGWDRGLGEGVSVFVDQLGHVVVRGVALEEMVLRLRQSGITIVNLFEESNND